MIMSNSFNKRVVFIDYAKALCIFLMIVGHWTKNEILLTYIYSFHMPTLFIVSGYLYKPRFFLNTIISFAIPYIIFSLFNLIVELLLGITSTDSIFLPDFIFRIVHYRYGLGNSLFIGDWFLWALIGLRFIFGDIPLLKPLRKHYLIIAIVCSIYMNFESFLISIDTIFHGYYIGRMIPSLLFFCFGFYLKDIQWNPVSVTPRTIIFMILAFIVLPILNNAHGINDNDFGYSYCLYAFIAILTTLLLFTLSSKLPPIEFVKTISRGTLVVLGSHIPILHILQYSLPETVSFLFPFITIIFCYLIIVICEKYFPVLLGKSPVISFTKNH